MADLPVNSIMRTRGHSSVNQPDGLGALVGAAAVLVVLIALALTGRVAYDRWLAQPAAAAAGRIVEAANHAVFATRD